MQLPPAAWYREQETLVAQVMGDLTIHEGPGVGDEVVGAAARAVDVVAA